MTCILCIPVRWLARSKWLARKLDLRPAVETRAEFKKHLADWDYTQTNDWPVLERDPAKDRVNQAAAMVADDPTSAFQALLALADEGSVWSMVYVGWCYYAGEGVQQDLARAEDWYRRAIKGGSQRAQLYLGWINWRRGSFDECERIFRQSGDEDWAPGLYWVARCRLKQKESQATLREARALLEKAATAGSPAAKWLLGSLMVSGRFGLREILPGFTMALEVSKAAHAEPEADGPTVIEPASIAA